MKAFQQNRLRKGLITVAWVAVACAGLLLLVAAMHKKLMKMLLTIQLIKLKQKTTALLKQEQTRL
jgi:hypothetical protein